MIISVFICRCERVYLYKNGKTNIQNFVFHAERIVKSILHRLLRSRASFMAMVTKF